MNSLFFLRNPVLWALAMAMILSSCTLPLKKDSSHGWTHQAVFISSQRISLLKERLKREPAATAWKEVYSNCNRGLKSKPNPPASWSIPGFYDDAEKHEAALLPLQEDAKLVYQLALCYRITDQKKFADQAVTILDAWATTLRKSDPSQVDTKLAMNERFPAMVAGADLIKDYEGWSIPAKTQFKKFIKEIVLPLNTMFPKKSNHANWGTLMVLSIAVFLDDIELFTKAESRFKELVDIQINKDGTMPFEMDRSDTKDWHGGPTKGKRGVWYTSYALMPTTLSAEILFLNGSDLFDYQGAMGGSLKLAYEKLASWYLQPETFPYYESNHGKLKGKLFISYFEILDILWPKPEVRKMLEDNRPLSADAGIPFLTFTHGSLGPEKMLLGLSR